MRYWPLVLAFVGVVGWAYRMDYMVRTMRSDVDRIIRHTVWGNRGEQGPAPPVEEK